MSAEPPTYLVDLSVVLGSSTIGGSGNIGAAAGQTV
jgi:hypothetical protein